MINETYHRRQMQFPNIGRQGQDYLRNSSVLVIGAGGLGSPVLLYLAGAGVGHIGICDHDTVRVENIHRQILYSIYDTTYDTTGDNSDGKGNDNQSLKKADVAAKRIAAVNPWIKITPIVREISASNINEIIRPYQLLIDCTDNMQTKFLLHDEALHSKKDLITAAISLLAGEIHSFLYASNEEQANLKFGCFHCLWPAGHNDPDNISNKTSNTSISDGVIGFVPAIIGAMQGLEALKVLLKWNNKLRPDETLSVNLSSMEITKLYRVKNNSCRFCLLYQKKKANE
ncbi:MAG: HesA/MoeB/ThiF family protein [Oligoflexia bacterium]|nr:HesA/MoeB/ThiF family protein [Oligoflexia bacterium]